MTTPRMLMLALTALLSLATRSVAAAPNVCQGRFDIDGAALDVGAPVDPVTSLRIRTTSGPDDQGGFAVRLADACDSVVGVQIPRSDAFVVRSRFVGCGERPRFRVRLAFDADCQTVTGRVRAAGALLATFTAHHVLDAPTQPGISADAPSITGFDPGSGARGDTITITGHNFDRDALGNRQDVPAYLVLFQSGRFGRDQAAFTVVSPEELSVEVPPSATSGLVVLAERLSGGTIGAEIARSPERFIVQGVFAPTTSTTTTTTPVTSTTSTTRRSTTTSSSSTTSTTRHSTTTTSRPTTTTTSTTRPPTTTSRPTTTTTSTSRPPTTTTLAASATVTFQPTNLSVFTAGTFSLVASGANQQIGALFDGNHNHVVDGFPGSPSLPYMRFPVPNATQTGFDLAFGSGYELNANAVVGAAFGPNGSAFLDVHFVVNGTVATPIFMSGGALTGNGTIVSTDSFTEQNVQVIAATATSPRIIRGHVAGVATFVDLDGNLFSDGIVLDFVLPLPNDA